MSVELVRSIIKKYNPTRSHRFERMESIGRSGHMLPEVGIALSSEIQISTYVTYLGQGVCHEARYA